MGSPAPQVTGRYTIYGKIASGGMASVHFGRLQGGAGFSRTVAIKRLHPHLAEDPEFMATMIDEARLAARIHHPNVVPTLDVVAADGELLVVMEYVRGESLARLAKVELERGGRVPLPIASAIAIGALHGLHAAHEATNDRGVPLGIVHRDVSPQNILVGVDGLARVIDFGVAKAAGRLQTTQDGTVKGKLAYMAPEQLAGHDVNRRADVYSMGVVLWELITGHRLFQATVDAALVAKVLAGAPGPPSSVVRDLPAGIDAIVMKALALDPAKRFATALEVAQALMPVIPPAFPTDVGAWCEEAARTSISQRGALLAEIESQSGVVPTAATSAPDIGSGSRRGAGRAAAPAVDDDAATIASDQALLLEERLGAPVPVTAASPPSALNVAPDDSQAAGMTPQRAALIGVGGAGVLIALALAIWAGHREPAPDRATAQPPIAATEQPSSEAPPVAVTPPSLPPPVAETTTASAAVAPPAPPASTMAVPPAALPPPTPPRAAVQPGSAPRAAAQKPPSAPNCTPPFTLDSAGHRQYKPECL